MEFSEIKVVWLVYFTKYALHIFVCFSTFYLRYNFMEIREGDFLIRKVSKEFPFWLKLINRAAQ